MKNKRKKWIGIGASAIILMSLLILVVNIHEGGSLWSIAGNVLTIFAMVFLIVSLKKVSNDRISL